MRVTHVHFIQFLDSIQSYIIASPIKTLFTFSYAISVNAEAIVIILGVTNKTIMDHPLHTQATK